MGSLTVANYLGLLEENPTDDRVLVELRGLVASRELGCTSDEALQLLATADQQALRRGDARLAVELLQLQIDLASGNKKLLAAMWIQMGRLLRDDLLEPQEARRAFETARGHSPKNEEAREALRQIDEMASTWRSVADRYVRQAEEASDSALKSQYCSRAASLIWQYAAERDDGEVDRLFRRAIELDVGEARVARIYAETLHVRNRWADMAQVLLDAAEATRSRDEVLYLLRRAARLFARQLSQPSQAALCYQRVRELARSDEEALQFLVAHYTELEQWDQLVAVYEDALRLRQNAEAERGVLVQIGMVHWRMRGNADDAEPYFARLRKHDPAHPGMLDFYRSYYAGDEGRARLLPIIGDAQRLSTDSDQKLALATEFARTAQHSEATLERAVDAWKVVQRLRPDDAEARASLRHLYRRTKKWNALIELLKAEVDTFSVDEERVAVLREMVEVYRDQLHLDVMVIRTYCTILELDPSDHDAVEQLAATYESLGRWSDLIQVLTRQAEASSDPTVRAGLYTRIASIWIDRFGNHNKATQPLEEAVALDPGDRISLGKLKDIYIKRRAWKPLFEVLLKEIKVASGLLEVVELRKEAALIAGERLHLASEATALWKQVLKDDPTQWNALEALENIAESQRDWGTLAEVLELMRLQLTDREQLLKCLQRLGNVYSDQLKDASRAVGVWRQVLTYDPAQARAVRVLREALTEAKDWRGLEELYTEAGDWEGLAEVFSGVAERSSDPNEKVDLSFRAATIYESRLEAPQRALRSYERILGVETRNVAAARALSSLYERREKWPRLVEVLEIVAEADTESPTTERMALLERLYDLAVRRLNDVSRAFRYAAAMFRLDPQSEQVNRILEESARKAAAYSDLVGLYKERLDQSRPDERLRLCWKIAAIFSDFLGDPDQAAVYLEEVLGLDSADEASSISLAKYYESSKKYRQLRDLVAGRLAYVADDDRRHDLLMELARIEETYLHDGEMATRRYRDILTIDAHDVGALASLYRLASAAQRWDEVVEVLPRVLERETDSVSRLRMSLDLAEVYLDRLGDGTAALAVLVKLLRDVPGDNAAIAMLERLAQLHPDLADEAFDCLEEGYCRTASHRNLADLLERRVAMTDDLDKVQDLRLRLSDVYQNKLNDWAQSFSCLAQVVDHRVQDIQLWDRLQDVARKSGMEEALVRTYVRVVDQGSLPPPEVAELSGRVAHLFHHVLDRAADAEPYYRRLLAYDPSGDEAFAALKELYSSGERWAELQALYRSRVAFIGDGPAKVEMLLQVALICDEFCDDPNGAIRSYHEILEVDPEQRAARRALDRLYRRVGQWRDVVNLVRQDLENAAGQEAVDARFDLAEIHHHHLGEPAIAVDFYEAVLRLSPTHLRSQQALEKLMGEASQRQRVATILEPIYEAQGAWNELAHVLEVELGDADSSQRLNILARLARIYENRVRDPEKAFLALSTAVNIAPEDLQLRAELARIADQRGWHRRRAAVLEQSLDVAAGSIELRCGLLQELAELWEEKEQDAERAESCLRQIVAAAGSDNLHLLHAVLSALERIHLQLGKYDELTIDLRQQIRFAESAAQRTVLRLRLVSLYDEVLHDAENAIAVCRECLVEDPENAAAFAALQRLYESQEKWLSLVEVLRSREMVVEEVDERQRILFRIAEVYETKLGDHDSAIAAYDEIAARFGYQAKILLALERLYESTQRWDELLQVLEIHFSASTDVAERAAMRLRMGHIAQHHTQSIEQCIGWYGEVLEFSPGHPAAIDALRRIVDDPQAAGRSAAAALLVPQYERAADYRGLVGALRIAAEVDESAARFDRLKRAALLAQDKLGQPAEAFALLRAAWKASPEDADLTVFFENFRSLARLAGCWQEYAETLQELYAKATDSSLRIDILVQLAEIANAGLGRPELARESWERVLQIDPVHALALDALEEIYRQGQQTSELIDVLGRKADIEPDIARRRDLLIRRAQLASQGLADEALIADCYERVLQEGLDQRAFEGLEVLYTRLQSWRRLVDLYERQIAASVGDVADLHYRSGCVQLQHLGDADAAIDHLRESLKSRPGHAPTVLQFEALLEDPSHQSTAAAVLEPVYLGRMDWPKLLRVLEIRLDQQADLESRKDLLRRVGKLNEEYLEDLEAALETYGRLLREDWRDQESWERLLRSARVSERFDRAAQIFSEVAGNLLVDESLAAKLAIVIGQIYHERLGDLKTASSWYDRVIRFDPNDAVVFGWLETTLTLSGSFGELTDLYLRQVEVVDDGEARIQYFQRAATVFENQLNNVERSLECHRRVLELDPQDPESLQHCDRLLERSSRWRELAEHLHQRIAASDGSPDNVTFRRRLGALLATKLNDDAAAIDAYEAVLEIVPNDPATVSALELLVQKLPLRGRVIAILEPIYRRQDEWRKLVALLEAQIEVEGDSGERFRKLIEIGGLHESRANDPTRAFAAWRRAYLEDPDSREARQEMERLAEILGNWGEVIEAFSTVASAQMDGSSRAVHLRNIAFLYDQKCDSPKEAIPVYEAILAIDPDDIAALEALESIHTLLGDWRGLVGVLERRADGCVGEDESSEFWRRIGEIYEEQLGDSSQAIKAYRQAVGDSGEDVVVLAALDRLYSATEDFESLSEILVRRLRVESGTMARVGVGLRLGELAEQRLHRAALATDAYRQVLDDFPGHDAALVALVRLYEAQGQWHELLQCLETQRSQAKTAAERAAVCCRLGQLHVDQFDNNLDAIQSYREALEADLSNPLAKKALLRIASMPDYLMAVADVLKPVLEVQQDWPELVRLVDAGLQLRTDPSERQFELRRLAEVQRQRLGDVVAAFSSLRRAFLEKPSEDRHLQDLEDMAAELGAWSEFVETLEVAAAELGDARASRSFHERIARVAEDRFPDVSKAIEVVQAAVDRLGDDEVLLSRLQQMLERAGRWTEFVDVAERRVGLALSAEDRTKLLLLLGTARARHLGDDVGAFAAFQEASGLLPMDGGVTECLEGLLDRHERLPDLFDLLSDLYRRQSRLVDLPSLYERRIAAASAAADRSRLLQELASLCELELNQPENALRAMQRAYACDPRDQLILDEIERIAASAGVWPMLDGFVENLPDVDRIEPALRRDLFLRAATWYSEWIVDLTAAERCLRAAVAADPSASEAYEPLVALLRQSGRRVELVSTLREWSGIEANEMRRIDMLREAGRVALELQDSPTAMALYEAVLAVDAYDNEALLCLSQLYHREQRWSDEAGLLRRRIDLQTELAGRMDLRLALAETYVQNLQQPELAVVCLEEAIGDDPTHPASLALLEQLLESLSRWSSLAELLERRLDEALSDQQRVAVRLRLARLHDEALDDLRGAELHLREALHLDPHHQEALASMEKLLMRGERWSELVELLDAQLRAAVAFNDVARRRRVRLQMATLLERQLGDLVGAAAIYDDLLGEVRAEPAGTTDPDQRLDLWQTASAFYRRSARTEAERQCLGVLVREGSGAIAGDAALRLIEMLPEPVGSDDDAGLLKEAIDSALYAYRLQPGHPQLRGRLESLLQSTGHAQHWASVLLQDAEHAENRQEKAGFLRRVAAIYAQDLGNPQQSAQYLEMVVQLDPDDRDSLLSLCDVYSASGRQAEAIPLLHQLINRQVDRRGRGVAVYHHRLGKAYEAAGNAEGALEQYVAAFKVDLTNVHILYDLGKLYYVLRDFEKAQKTFRALLLQKLDPQLGISKSDVYFYLGDIAFRGGDKTKAVAMLERALSEQREHSQALELLTQLRQ